MINIDDLTQRERQDLLLRLLDGVPGPIPAADGSALLSFVSRYNVVKPRETATISTVCHAPFQPLRLVILEPIIERIEREIIEEAREETVDDIEQVTRGALWWKRTVSLPVKTTRPVAVRRTVEHKRDVRIERGAWTVHAVYVGQQNQFLDTSYIGGEAFGPDGTMNLIGDDCPVGYTISATVSHCCSDAVPFHGVIIGKMLKPTDLPQSRRRRSAA